MSIGKAWVCDHCDRAFRIERKAEYINHLKIHAEKRLKKHFKKKYSAIIEEKRSRLDSSKSAEETISIISEMTTLEIGFIDGDYRYLEDIPRNGEFNKIYSFKFIGELSFRCFEYGKEHVDVNINMDSDNFQIIRSFVGIRSTRLYVDSEDHGKLTYRYHIYDCPDFIKILHKRHYAIQKLKE